MITLVEAINQALHYEMSQDETVVVFGEDVGKNGGVFRATDGLQEAFGKRRVRDTPLAETMIAGIAIGMAANGLKPIAEFQFLGFMYAGLEQIISHASRLRNRTRGTLNCPIVYRAPCGGGVHAPEHHSESVEALFAHIPGLRVVIPSSPIQAYGLLLSSIRSLDPVIFLEPLRLYRLFKQPVLNDGKGLPLDKCFLLKEGTDMTLVTWGAMVVESMKAATLLQDQHGISVEVIDVATVKPIDMESIITSIEKTRRCLIVHEAARFCGIGAEIAAQIGEYGSDLLKAPVKRLTGYDTIIPYSKKESIYIPDAKKISETVLKMWDS